MEPQHERRTKGKHGGFTGCSPHLRTANAQTVSHIHSKRNLIAAPKHKGVLFVCFKDIWEHLHRIGLGQSLGFKDSCLLYTATGCSFLSCGEGQERNPKTIKGVPEDQLETFNPAERGRLQMWR